jgi:recombinational DNA repair protein RecR
MKPEDVLAKETLGAFLQKYFTIHNQIKAVELLKLQIMYVKQLEYFIHDFT